MALGYSAHVLWCDSLKSIGLFRWERLGDIVVLPVTSFKDPVWDTIGAEIWPIVAKALNARRLARQVSYMLELHINWYIFLISGK